MSSQSTRDCDTVTTSFIENDDCDASENIVLGTTNRKRSLSVVGSDDIVKTKKNTFALRISNKGRVRNSFGHIFRGSETRAGYKIFSCHGMYCFVHVLVALHFIGPPPEGKTQIDHIDRNRGNNEVTNLRHVSRSENALNCKKNIVKPMLNKPVEAKKVIEDDSCWIQFESMNEAAESLKCSAKLISHVCKGKLWQTEGYIFRYQKCLLETLPGEEFRKIFLGNVCANTEVSNFGRLRDINGLIRQGSLRADGYCATQIEGKTYVVHRLVAIAFNEIIGQQPSDSHSIDHIDRNRGNNAISNLRWASRIEQRNNMVWKRKTFNSIKARKVGESEWTVYRSVKDASEILNLSSLRISNIIKSTGVLDGYEFQKVDPDVLEGEGGWI
jgi:hypothetical protein